METIFRPEQAADIASIRALVAAAFRRPGSEAEPGEAALVDALRSAGALIFSYVAESDGAVVGHIGISPMMVASRDGEDWEALAMGPVAVEPAFQGQGVGSALARAVLERCREAGRPVVFLLGNPAFYGRFGFIPASERGLFWANHDAGEHFQVWEAFPGAIPSGGSARFHSAFDAV